MLYTVLLLLCMAGAVNMQAAGAACGASDACNANLVCQEGKCRVKIDDACTASSTDECVITAAACPATAPLQCKCGADQQANAGKTACECTDTKKTLNAAKACVLKAGEACTAVGDCIANTDCTGDPKKCTCKAGSMANADKTMCMKKVGQTCAANDADCVDGSECKSEKCTCKTDYMAMYDMSACRKAPGKSCGGNNGACGENADCTQNKCVCKSGYVSQEGERCGKKVGATCGQAKECVMNADCTDSKCKCKENYEATGDFCSGASALMSSLMLLVAMFVTSRWM